MKDVLKIIELSKSGNYLQKDLASMFNVHRSAIARIVQGKAWIHLKEVINNPYNENRD